MILGGLFARIASGPSSRYLRADVSAGVIEYVNGAETTSCSLDELGPLDITEKSRWYHLTAPGLPNRVLYDALTAKDVQNLHAQLQVQLDGLHDQSAVRRVLAETPTDGSGFRAAPDLFELVRAAVDDPRRLHAALVALENDRDVEVGRKAAELRRNHLVAVTRTVGQRERAMEPRLGSRAFAALWLLLWFTAVLAGGYMIVHLELLRDDLAGLGVLMAAAMGGIFSWIGSVGRRLQQERRAIRLELRTWALAPLWCTLGFGVALVASWAFFDELGPFSSRYNLGALAFYLLVMLLGGLFARACSGPSKEYLRVDTDAGVVEYVHGGVVTACPLDKLGRFEIVKTHSGSGRNRVTNHQLVAPGLPDRILYDSIYPRGSRSDRCRCSSASTSYATSSRSSARRRPHDAEDEATATGVLALAYHAEA